MNNDDDYDSAGEYDDAGSFDSDDENDDESYEDLDDAFALYMEAACEGNRVTENKKTSAELWADFLADPSKVLKLTDECLDKFDLRDAVTANQVIEAVQQNPGLTHVILGHKFLQLVDQVGLLHALCAHHSSTMKYIKLCPKLEGFPIQMEILLSTLTRLPHLTELELNNLILQQDEGQVDTLATLFRKSSLRQIYIFGIDVRGGDTQAESSLDPIFRALGALEPLDELRLEGLGCPSVGSLVSPSALQDLLRIKEKWWRLGLDNMGLSDEHVLVVSEMIGRNENCRVGDLLSFKSNPAITQVGYKNIFAVCFQRGRMGLVKVDDPHWEAEFDLVRSMNNLHGRLDIIVKGRITSKEEWVDWVSRIGTSATWEPASKKLNYLWFALREHPGIVDN